MIIIEILIEIFVGFASGLAVGAGLVAFLTVLGIVPRLIQLSKTSRFMETYEASVVIGSLVGVFFSFSEIVLNLPSIFVVIWGSLHGVFIGMLAAALTEVLNVFPLLAKRIGLGNHLIWLLMAIVFGKIFGSIFQWTVFVK